ncbi:uncharacterized protein LOC132709461, partial [Pantherophis guttatus]
MDLRLLFLILLVQPISGRLRMKCPLNLKHQSRKKPWSYYRPGDYLISMITTGTKIVRMTMMLFDSAPYNQFDTLPFDMLRILRYIFNIQVVNKTPGLLKNLTLGYNIHDNYLNRLVTSDALLDMLSMGEANVPNYSCGRKDHLLALVDAATDDISIQMSTLGGPYKVPQFHPFLEKTEFLNLSIYELYLDQNGDLAANLKIVSWVFFPEKYLIKEKVVTFERQRIIINQTLLSWLKSRNRSLPQSKCVGKCQPGFVKRAREGEPVCCYDCVPCPEGTISIQEGAHAEDNGRTCGSGFIQSKSVKLASSSYHHIGTFFPFDMEQCINCLDDKYPNGDRIQ